MPRELSRLNEDEWEELARLTYVASLEVLDSPSATDQSELYQALELTHAFAHAVLAHEQQLRHDRGETG